MAQLPGIGLSWPLTKPPFGSCAIYFFQSVVDFMTISEPCDIIYTYRQIIKYMMIYLYNAISGTRVPCTITSICSIVPLFQDRDSRSNTFCGHTFSGDMWSCFWPTVKEYDSQNNQ